MRIIYHTIIFFVLWAIHGSIASAETNNIGEAAGISVDYSKLCQETANLEPDSQAVAKVSGLTLNRDEGRFILQEGFIYLCKPIKGRVVSAIFEGQGIFSFRPPLEIERQQLRRFYETDTLYREFTHLHIIFGDYTEEELRSQLEFGAGTISNNSKKVMTNSLKYILNKDKTLIDEDIAKTILEDRVNDQFYAYIQCFGKGCDSKEPLFFRINPFSDEPVSLSRKVPKSKYYDRETICRFNKSESISMSQDSYSGIICTYWIKNYDIDVSFDQNLNINAAAKIQFISGLEKQRSISMYLYHELVVDSVVWGDGQNIDFYRPEKSSKLLINSPYLLSATTEDSLVIYYRGEIIKRELHWYVMETLEDWYPNPGIRYPPQYRPRFDLNFSYPERFEFAASAEKVSEVTADKMIVSHWATPNPVRAVSFNIGFFKKYEIEDDRFPTTTVLISKMGHKELADVISRLRVKMDLTDEEREFLNDFGDISGAGMEKQVGADVANSLALYTQIFGSSPVNNIYAAEISYVGTASAYNGLVHLPIENFQSTDRMGYARMLRAHEVAHQWWGIGVDYLTYRDKWLSEAFADYSGFLYLQWVLKDNKKFFARLKETKKKILSEYSRKYRDDRFAGPIGLGYRADSSERPGGYLLMVYEKGAWVLHMLRNMLIDFSTMNEDSFMGLMRQFYADYRGKSATTENFKNLASRVAGENLDWFFDEWVYGVDIPTYEFLYKVEKNNNDAYLIKCRVRQLNVPDSFQMYVPILIDFGEGRKLRSRQLIKGPITEFEIPALPLKPENIIFNDLESVLCDVNNKKWNDD